MPQRDIWVGVSCISSSLKIQFDYLSIFHGYPLSLNPNQFYFDMWLFLIGPGSGFRKSNHEWMKWIGCLFCFSTFSLQTSQAQPHRSEEWSGAVETTLHWRGKEGVEVGSIHIRFELSPHFTGLRGKQLLLTLMLDIPKYKKSASSAAKDMEVIISVRFHFTTSFVKTCFLLHCSVFIMP